MDEDKVISLEDLDDELEDYTFDMEGGAEPEPEITIGSIDLATDSSMNLILPWLRLKFLKLKSLKLKSLKLKSEAEAPEPEPSLKLKRIKV